jgi:L-fuconolactonase
MRIDGHQHFWQLATRVGDWPPPELAAIHRDFMPDNLAPLLAEGGIDGTILVQSLPSLADTEFMLGLAAHHSFILGVVGWVDLKAADAPAQITILSADSKLKGLRPLLQSLPADWLDDPALDPAIAAMQAANLAFDALALPPHLPSLLRFARRFPALPIVIDHGAKPEIARGGTPGWRADMAALAALPNVFCKLSGLLTEAGALTGLEDIRPYAETLFTLFGPDRLIWGSDWPVLNLGGDYRGWQTMAEALIPAEAHPAVFGDTARNFYRLA